jgi:hypothetical protein
MTEYRPQRDYNNLAIVLEEVYQKAEGPMRDAVVELHTALRRTAEAGDPDTELARLKNAQAALVVLRDFQEQMGYNTFTPERMQELLAQAQERLERGLPAETPSRRNDRGSSRRGLSIAVALFLTI